MKAVLVHEVGSFAIEDVPDPVPHDGEVIVRVQVTGLCRTDLKLIRKGHRDLTLPRIPGEEVVGEISAIGPGVTHLEVGHRVYVYPGTSCGVCRACVGGYENLCRSMQIMGFHRDGGFAPFVRVPAQSIIPLPVGLHADTAVFAEPLSCCLNALELARLAHGDHIGIWGAGPAGTLLARLAAARGATPHVHETDPRRQPPPSAMPPPAHGFDVCIVAVGAPDAYSDALSRLAPRGRLVVFSGLAPDAATLPVNLNELHYHEQTVVGAYGCQYRHGVEALQLLHSGAVRVTDLVSHRLPLNDLAVGLDIVEQRSGMKVLLYPTL